MKQQRLQAIRDKIAARAELLSRPQRFATSQPLSRREMEIEQALFQGKDRLGFLTALYHRGLEFLYVNILEPQLVFVAALVNKVIFKYIHLKTVTKEGCKFHS